MKIEVSKIYDIIFNDITFDNIIDVIVDNILDNDIITEVRLLYIKYVSNYNYQRPGDKDKNTLIRFTS